MSLEIIVFAIIAVLLATAVIGVRSRRVEALPDDSVAAPSVLMLIPSAIPAAARLPFVPPEGSIMAAQLEIGQTIHLETETARYSLTLRDPITGLYDAVHIGEGADGKRTRRSPQESSFQMLFFGSNVPARRFVEGWFVIGGRLAYRKLGPDDTCTEAITSTTIRRVIFSIPLKQAS